MIERRRKELELVAADYGQLEFSPDLDWFIIRDWKLPPGWNKSQTDVLVLIPPGYPVTPPDNFHTDPDLRLDNDGQPGNTSAGHNQLGRAWLLFSYHVDGGDWRPHADPREGHNLLTFLDGVVKRLSERN